MSIEVEKATQRLKEALETTAFIPAEKEKIVRRGGRENSSGWLFDIRRIILQPQVLEDISALFWEKFADKRSVQVGGIEVAAIPLITTLVVSGAKNHPYVSGFFIRKSRKKDGLTRMIEGEIRNNADIILVDDIINSAKSMMRQVEVLEGLGHRVTAIWTLLRFRDPEYYTYFKEKGISIHSAFELNDFTQTLGTENLVTRTTPAQHDPFSILWKFQADNPSYQYVISKSEPIIDDERIYFGSDSGTFWALNQKDGSVAWTRGTGRHPKGKGIFSSPALHGGVVYFGGYDGNFYALDALSGDTKWVFFEADWIGSSPALAQDLGLVFVGLEFGLWRKRGGIAAIDIKSGKKVWSFSEMPCYTHSSPLYIKEHHQIVVGSNDGCAYLFDAKTGALVWKACTGTLTDAERNSGFSRFDIKESFAYDATRDLIVFGNGEGNLYFLDRRSGKARSTYSAEFAFYATPLIHNGNVYASSLDKYLYCIDLDTFTEKWRWYSGARIFASPAYIESSIYIGSNSGHLTELDPETGEERSFMTFSERITNRPVFNPRSKRFFVPTYANEIYCLAKQEVPESQPHVSSKAEIASNQDNARESRA